jgi:hypothetical protein
MRSTADLSILSWRLPIPNDLQLSSPSGSEKYPSRPEEHPRVLTGVLAPSSAYFCHSATFIHTAKHGLARILSLKHRHQTQYETIPRHQQPLAHVAIAVCMYCAPKESRNSLLHRGEQRYLRVSPLRIYPRDYDVADLPLDRYLLTKMPLDRWDHCLPLRSMEETKLDTQSHLVQILPLRFVESIFDPWPVDHYDSSDQIFFIGRDYSKDMCTIDIRMILSPEENIVVRLVALG